MDIDDKEDFKLTALENSKRFGEPMSSEAVCAQISGRVPKNTTQTTAWAHSVWLAWYKARKIEKPVAKMSLEEIDEHLSHFVFETRRQDGNPYPPKTLYQLVCGLQRFLRENGRPEVAMFDERNPTFDQSRKALDAKMKQLTSQGVGTATKSAEPLTAEQETILWEQDLFSVHSAEGLINAVFWYSCKCFGLRAGDEHRNLVREQFAIGVDSVGRYLEFNGRSSKNVQGGLKQKNVQTKKLKIYSKPEIGERCVVDLFSTYMALIPESGPFYRRPIKGSYDPPRFSVQVLGKNTLGTIVKRFCNEAGFSGQYTNHSGKVTCATTLFKENIDEQLIKRQTGHRSDAVRVYKRPCSSHDVAVSDALQVPQSGTKQVKTEHSSEIPSSLNMGPKAGGMQRPVFNFNISFNSQ